MSSQPVANPASLPRADWRAPLLGFAAAAALLLALWRATGGSLEDLSQRLREAALVPLGVAVAAAPLLLALQGLRWWLVLRRLGPATYPQAVRALAVGFLFNTVLPARGGALLRAEHLGRHAGIGTAPALGSEFVDFFVDKLGWMVAFAVVCAVAAPPGWMWSALAFMGVLSAGCAVLLLLIARGWSSARRGSRLAAWVARLRHGIPAGHWGSLLAVEALAAPLPWLFEALVLVAAAPAVGLSLGPAEAFAVLTAFNLATTVPSPANAGTVEAGGALALVNLGAAPAAALAFIALYHVTQLVPGACAGAVVIWTDRAPARQAR